MTTLEYKQADAAIVAVPASEEGTHQATGSRVIAGYASLFGPPPDLVGDVISPAAYSASLRVRPSVPVLAAHDSGRPIGRTILLSQTPEGLLFKAELARGVTAADDTLALIEQGIVTTMSIGFNVKQAHAGSWEGQRVRFLDEIDLHEISPVLWAAAPTTSVSLSKAAILDAVAIAEYQALGDSAPFEVKRAGLLALTRQELSKDAAGGSTDETPDELDKRRRVLLAELDLLAAEGRRR